MSNLEEVRSELIELENEVALRIDLIKEYRDSVPDSIERRSKLAKMQMDLGKKVRRLRDLRGLI